ncbi:hypothetical protein OJO68_16545 [Escherichia coli]|nr:hypothetical protein [Escherichia coli]MCW3189338.1 hypothetical protein [Escherichia coli]
MNNDIVDSIPLAWMLLFDDYDFTQEHYNQLRNFSSEELHEIIAEMAGCHSSARSLLRNKWLTSPEDILSQVTSEYEWRVQNCPYCRNEHDAESWLHELSCAVITPLSRVAPGQFELLLSFILQLIRTQEDVYNLMATSDGYLWHSALYDMLLHILVQIIGVQSECLKKRTGEMLKELEMGQFVEEIKSRVKYLQCNEQRSVLNTFINNCLAEE